MLVLEGVAVDPWGTLKVGDPNPSDVDVIHADPCTFVWVTQDDVGAPYTVCCTRRDGHKGSQHVAEGTEDTGVIAVHAWTEE